MKLSSNGRKLIQSYEGLRLKAYKAVPTEKYWTIGYGHYGKDVTEGMTITKKRADELFTQDVARFEDGVERLVKVELNENQFDSLVSLAYNIGLGAFERSTLLRKLNEKDYAGAGKEFARWVKSGGKTLNGLVKRRAEEAELFLTPVKSKPKPKPKPKAKPSTHKVKAGDTLSEIAQKHGTTVAKLKRLNPKIKNVNLIFVGQVIKLK